MLNFDAFTFTTLSIILHITVVRAFGRFFERLVGSFPGFDFGIIVDSNHFSGKYLCYPILLCRARREYNPSRGRCFNIPLWILSGP